MLCAQGPAPRAATIERYRDELGLELVPGTGPLAAVVPGAFGGWLAMLRDYGTMPLRDVLRFAIGYAEDGYPVLPQIARRDPQRRVALPRRVDDVGRGVPAGPGAGHAAPQPAARGDVPAARRRVEASDRASRSRGARLLVPRLRRRRDPRASSEREWMDSSGERHAGLLAEDDLRDWRPTTSSRSRSTTTG